jgi:squalene monooxygenase
LFLRDQHFTITYPDGEMGRGLRNGKFVQQMRSYILGHPNIKVYEGNVVNLIQEGGAVRGACYLPKNGETSINVHAALTIVCDGMFSSFRAQLSDSPKNISSYFMGFVLHDCVLPFPGHGHVIVAESSPILCYPISSTETRILIDFPGGQAPRKGEELTAFLKNKIGPQLPIAIQPSYYTAVDEGKFKVMPNHLIPAKPKQVQGAVLIGDSLNMRHPLTAGGMTVALSDVRHLGSNLINIKEGFTPEAIDEAVTSFYKNRYEQNASINILADALYAVMSNEELKESCYTYMQKGGECASIPLSLLSALNRDQSDLLQHFFAVAVHGAKRILLPSPSPAKVRRSFKMLKDAVHIISPLVLNEQPGPWTRATFMVAEKIF